MGLIDSGFSGLSVEAHEGLGDIGQRMKKGRGFDPQLDCIICPIFLAFSIWQEVAGNKYQQDCWEYLGPGVLVKTINRWRTRGGQMASALTTSSGRWPGARYISTAMECTTGTPLGPSATTHPAGIDRDASGTPTMWYDAGSSIFKSLRPASILSRSLRGGVKVHQSSGSSNNQSCQLPVASTEAGSQEETKPLLICQVNHPDSSV